MKEFNLSEKIRHTRKFEFGKKEEECEIICSKLFIEDVKEFIRLLKERLKDDPFYPLIFEKIDKLAGKYLK